MQRVWKKQVTAEPTKTFKEFIEGLEETPVDQQSEAVDIFGNCLWKIFSNNHTVYNERYEAYELGSWRASGRFIADVINELHLVPDKSFDYLDFYMGHYILEDRDDLTKIYEFIFRKLKHKRLNWVYSFPRMSLVNFNNKEDAEQKPEAYDPAKDMERQLVQQQEQQALDSFQQKLDTIYHQEYEEAKYNKPAQEVMAYYYVYGHWPHGHPLN